MRKVKDWLQRSYATFMQAMFESGTPAMWTPQASSPSTTSEDGTWTGFDERWRFPEGEAASVTPIRPVTYHDLRSALGLEVVGAYTEHPQIMYVNKDGSTGLIRPALEPEIRMWKLLERIKEGE
jgi:hypothetical protein